MTLQEAGKATAKKLYVVGNYRFTGKLLGKGNFARVEEAVHNILNIKVAIKIMEINQIKEEYVIRNLCREAKLMAKLSHPCICALYQTMQRSDNVYYLVTELATGGDLCSFIKEQRNGRLEERPARIYARQFVSALAHMHHIGVVHRDLKMENVMLNSARTQIKIVDFGLSNLYDPAEKLRTHCGSPEYAAPELFVTGMKYGPEVDLWSLGIILYGMVAGQLPFVSNRTEQISSQERRKRLVTQINKGLGSSHKKTLACFSSDFRNVVTRLLVADSSKRMTVKEMLVHPYITDKGTKMLRINPMKKLDMRQQAEIISEICDRTHKSSEEVISQLKQEPLSKTAGMFNILAHQKRLSRLSGDGVSKVYPIIEQSSKEKHSQESPPVRRPYNLRNSSAPLANNRGDSYLPRVIVQDRKLSLTIDSSRRETQKPATPSTAGRPKTVLSKSPEKKSNYRDLKPYLAGVTSKSLRPATVSDPAGASNVIMASVNTRIAKEVARKMASNEQKAAGNYSSVLPNGFKINLVSDQSGATSRASTALERKQRSKSEKLPSTRPATTVASLARKSLGTTQSDSKTTSWNRPQTTTGKDSKPFSRLLRISRPAAAAGIEKNSMAYGDIAQKNQALSQKLKKPTIYDPIARSIAGYVCNNVPNHKLPTLSHFKK